MAWIARLGHRLGFTWLDDLGQDLRFAVRHLVRDRRFAVGTVLTLALGLGSTTIIFSILDTVVLKPLPFAHANRLVQLYGTPAVRGEFLDRLDEYRREATSFESIAGYEVTGRYLRTSSGPERVMAVAAERELFPMLGVPPLMGRTFGPGDEADVAVVAEAFWTQRLGSSPSVVGSTIALDGDRFTIIGIMPASFQFPYHASSILPGVAAQTRT